MTALMSPSTPEVSCGARGLNTSICMYQNIECGIHHLVVVDGSKAVGIVSSYDLLGLVEEKS